MSVISRTFESSPAILRLVAGFRDARVQPMPARERLVESAMAGALAVTAAAMAASIPAGLNVDAATACVLVGWFALATRIRFAAPGGFSDVSQLALVPMLLLVPPHIVPLLVASGLVLGHLPDYLTGKRHAGRALLVLGDSWYAVAPALVLIAAGSPELAASHWPVYVAALAAQLVGDAAVWSVRSWLTLGMAPRLQPAALGWVYLVDVLLAPIGFLGALAAIEMRFGFLLLLPLAALLAIFARERETRIDNALELSSAYHGTALLLSDVLESDDEYTGLHSRSVVSLALEVADEMRLDSSARRNVEFGALLHDVGKIAIPNEIINKPGPLTPEEWVVMGTHTIEGQKMLNKVGGVLREVGLIVRASHEHYDGSGYPDGLAGDDIPLEACIVSACDALSAMTTDRSYRKAMSTEQAVEELRACSGSQFHPGVVEVLIRIVER